jgi:galactose oxidase
LATRPVISQLSATTLSVGQTLTVSFSSGVTSNLVLVRMGSVTHSINSDQRRIPLSNVSVSGNSATARLPSDSGILIVGNYYVFAISSAGVPSVARTLRVTL